MLKNGKSAIRVLGSNTRRLTNITVTSFTRQARPNFSFTNGVSAVHTFGFQSARFASTFKTNYDGAAAERAQQGIVPKPLDAAGTNELVGLLKNPSKDEEAFLLDLLTNRIPAGVDEAAYVKAAFLTAITKGEATSPVVSAEHAVELLSTMQGGYNILTLVQLLDDPKLASKAADGLSKTILMFEAFHDVEMKANKGNVHAKRVMQSWANAEWFLSKPEVPKKVTVTVFKVPGETNTDDLSPAPDAWSRPDVPLHALAMLKLPREGITPDVEGSVGPITVYDKLKEKGFPLAYVGDVVGTGSSRKSATNSILWFFGNDIPNVPNKRGGGVCIGNNIAPIFYNTMEDSGALPLEMSVDKMHTGDVIDIYPYEGVTKNRETGEVVANFSLKTDILLDEVRAGGRIPLIIGKSLTAKARASLGLGASSVFRTAVVDPSIKAPKGYTLAQKMVGRACGFPAGKGMIPGQYCEPSLSTVGSQDTTGPMTRDELKDLACLGFSADLVMQSFCHTAAYPKPVDVVTHHTLPDFIRTRGGVSLRPGDGIIHSWLNRMLLPDTLGTGGDSHTRFPIGMSFPAGSGLVAFAAATGIMPLDMPESVLVRFSGELQPGITLRDLVHAIPYYAIQQGLLTVEKQGKKNVFSGRILEIEGLPDLTCEQAFELSDASAERSAAGCSIKLNKEPIAEYLTSNITLLKWMIAEGYGDARTLARRIAKMDAWLQNPTLLEADKDATYAAEIHINLNDVKEPILCAPNDPDDARLLSSVAGQKVDEVFIGSCMTNIGHFRAAGKLLSKYEGQLPTRLWVAPPTRMDEEQLIAEGYYSTFGKVGARTEMPGCSLCMGNQARVADKSSVVSTSTRNFPNRLGKGANVFLASAELAAVTAIEGKLPTVAEYMKYSDRIHATAKDTFRYLNFDRLPDFVSKADKVDLGADYPTLLAKEIERLKKLDEPRFHKSAIAHPTNSQIHGYTKVETEKHVGPGVYFTNVEEEKRNGWASRSFSRREPMTPSKSNSPSTRNEHYTAGVVTSYGALASPMSPSQRNNPGPGHYDGNIMTSFPNSPKMNRPSSADSLNGSLSRSGSRLSRMDTSPRFALNTSLCMKDGILFQSRENNEKLLGPGHYPAAQKNELLKKSHNVRVSSQKVSSPQARIQPITDIRQTFGTPGSTFRTPSGAGQNSPQSRPRSASSSPLNRNQFSYGRNGGFFSPYN